MSALKGKNRVAVLHRPYISELVESFSVALVENIKQIITTLKNVSIVGRTERRNSPSTEKIKPKTKGGLNGSRITALIAVITRREGIRATLPLWPSHKDGGE